VDFSESFIGPSNQTASIAADSQRTLNLYSELVSPPGRRPVWALFRTPGRKLLQTLPDAPIRGEFSINGRMFAAAGSGFYELLTPTSYILRGAIPTGSTPVYMADNSIQIGIVASGLVYMFTLASNTFAQVLGQAGLPSYARTITSIDTYFLVLGDGNQFARSALLDGMTWSGADFGSSQQADNAVVLASLHNYLWLFGNVSTVIFQDTGSTSNTFERVTGSQIEQGCAAPASVAVLDNTLYWLGDDSRGPAIVYRADGFLPTRVSTHAVESAIKNYPTRADAIAFAYQESGHVFYVLNFPSANNGAGATWVYDRATDQWHERGTWDITVGAYGADRARFHAFAWGLHIVGDYATGNLYDSSTAYADDNGGPLRWLRAAPHLVKEQAWIYYDSFQLDMQTGSAPDGQTTSPKLWLRWSNDGGFTWSNDHEGWSGALGNYAKRVIWRRLGRARNRVFEVSGSDPVPMLCLTGAYLELEIGES
jgi:hypothetical protein